MVFFFIMTNPKGELFAVANSARAEQLASEAARKAAQAIENAEAKQRQRLADQKKVADKKKSDEYANAFVEIMRKQGSGIPTTELFNIRSVQTGYTDPPRGALGKGDLSRPTFKTSVSKVGEGWILEPYLPAFRSGDGETYRPARPALLLLPNLNAYRTAEPWDPSSYYAKHARISTIPADASVIYTSEKESVSKLALHAPFSDEDGIKLLGSFLNDHNIVSSEDS